MSQLGLPLKCLNELKAMGREGRLTQAEMEDVLLRLFPHLQKKKKNRQTVLEATAFAYYCQSEWFIEHLMCDDAPQFNKLSRFKALCWIHEGRHYKKLDPVFPSYRKLLNDFLEKFWDFYAELQAYKLAPSKEKAEKLDKEFDELFLTKSNYATLDARKTKTLAKKIAYCAYSSSHSCHFIITLLNWELVLKHVYVISICRLLVLMGPKRKILSLLLFKPQKNWA